MSLYLEGKQAKSIDARLAKYGVERGRKIGDGCFSNVYAIKGNRTQVLKLSVCEAQLAFLDRFQGSPNPHFPKRYEYLGVVAEYDYSDTDKPLYAYKVERLKPAQWQGLALKNFYNIASDALGCQSSGERSIERIDDTISGLMKRNDEGVPIPGSLIRAMEDVKRMMSAFNNDSITLDLHDENYMMRGKQLVINDPVCDSRLFY